MKNLPWNKFKEPQIEGEIRKIADASLYQHGNVKTAPILNNFWFQQNLNKGSNYKHNMILVTDWNWDSFSALWGARNFQFEGEFLYDVWAVTFADEVFILYTADQKGTSIEIVIDNADEFMDDDKKGKKCYVFWNKLADHIATASPKKTEFLKNLGKK